MTALILLIIFGSFIGCTLALLGCILTTFVLLKEVAEDD